jgi:hypothetical protein
MNNLLFITHLKKRVKEIKNEIRTTQNVKEINELNYTLGRVEGIIYIIKILNKFEK